MFDWLFEGTKAVYITLGVVAVILVILWWQNQSRRWLAAVGVVGVLIGLYWLLDRLVTTDREEIDQRVQRMAAAVKRGDVDQAFQFFDDQFKTPKGRSKEEFREFARNYIQQGRVNEVIVWPCEFPEAPDRQKRTVPVAFQFKFAGNEPGAGVPYRCESVFAYSTQHGWRMKSCKIYFATSNEELAVDF